MYSSRRQVLDIVPVSGLVMSCFVRLENELKTVLELWDPELRGKSICASACTCHCSYTCYCT
jgi:hypothetical protein